MKSQINEIRRLQQLAGIITESQLNEGPSSLAKIVSKLYEKMLKTGKSYDIDDELVDDIMEKIVKKVGHTPEQKKIKGFYKFAFGDHPEFKTLTDAQLQAIAPFLKAVIKRGEFSGLDMDWDGTKIISDYDDED